MINPAGADSFRNMIPQDIAAQGGGLAANNGGIKSNPLTDNAGAPQGAQSRNNVPASTQATLERRGESRAGANRSTGGSSASQGQSQGAQAQSGDKKPNGAEDRFKKLMKGLDMLGQLISKITSIVTPILSAAKKIASPI
ncbi:hypothetical protein [Burkholderia ubonensis]|uniref:hypothetical protein n=1 Tax=Burkholderia ubonensis TaxID=101571 RepID=UPI000AC8430B|nr:hypothetical protein [Burkholderia ubonensis]